MLSHYTLHTSAPLRVVAACAWDYMVTKCSFFDVTLRGMSVRAGKAFQGGLNGAVQRPRAWRAAPRRVFQLGRPCKPVRSLRKMLLFTHVPPVVHTHPPLEVKGGHHGNRRPSPPAPSPANPGLTPLSTHPGAALRGLVTHGSAGGVRRQRHLVVGVVGGGGGGGGHGHHHRFSM